MTTAITCPCCGTGSIELPDHSHTGERIAWLRKMRGLDQGKLAELVDKSRAQISNIESGRFSMTVKQLPRYAEALGVQARDLVV